MNKFLLIGVSVLGLFLSSEAYCASSCTPDFVPKCKCQFPVYDGKELKCGDDYCAKNGKICMNNGSCCTTPNQAKTQCCDTNGNGVANDDTCCPALETEGCETEVDTTTGCNVCKKEVNDCEGKSDYTSCKNGNGYCYQEYCLTRGSLNYQCTQWIAIMNTVEYANKGSSGNNFFEKDGNICTLIGDGTVYSCHKYGKIVAENPYEISQCASGNGGMCIVDYHSGFPYSGSASSSDYYNGPMEVHPSGFCVD